MPTDAAFTLSTEITTASAPADIVYAIGAACDGSLWAAANGLYVYSPVQGAFVEVDCAMAPPGTAAFPPCLAPVSQELCYYLSQPTGTDAVHVMQCQGDLASSAPTLTSLTPPPATPTAISAGWDGTLWIACGTDVYAYDSGSWTSIASPVTDDTATLGVLSVGNSGFILALVNDAGVPSILSYSGSGWDQFAGGTPSGTVWVAACGDGAYWTFDGQTLTLTPPQLPAVSFPLGPELPLGYALAAASAYGCYFWSTSSPDFQIQIASWGVLETPALGFPAFAGDQLTAYQAVNTTLGVTDLRESYTNLAAPLSSYQSDLEAMACPSGVEESDWTAVQSQLNAELTAAIAVIALFGQMEMLSTQIQLTQTDAFNSVVQMIGLPTVLPNTGVSVVLSLIFKDLWTAATGVVQEQLKSAGMGQLFTVVNDLYQIAAAAIAANNGANTPQEPIQIPCSQLAATLVSVIQQVATTSGANLNTILENWGMLSVCGAAIGSNLWYWPPEFDATSLSGVGSANALQFYQALMPVQYRILVIEIFMEGPTYAPLYSYVYYYYGSGDQVLSWCYVCASSTASATPYTTGPFPAQALVEAITALCVDNSDMFLGQNGWAIPQVVGETTTLPPLAGAILMPWTNSSSTF